MPATVPDADRPVDRPADRRAADEPRAAVRHFGRLQLLRLLGRSERTMAWAAVEPDGAERMLVLPRTQPRTRAALAGWIDAVRYGARLTHPQLAPALEIGVQDDWPFVLYDLAERVTVADRLPRSGWPAAEAVAVAVQALRALAYAHDAGAAHHDLQPWLLLHDAQGGVRLAGLAVGEPPDGGPAGPADPAHDDGTELSAQRQAAERDLAAFGVLMHPLLGGKPALDEPDVGRVLARMPPQGRELVRLPWSGAHSIPEPLRAIVNRATDRQPRRRYRHARTLLAALEGWQQAEAGTEGGALGLLADRLRAAGVLPSAPGASTRVARLALHEQRRTSEMADIVLEDPALAFELLRAVNGAQVRGVLIAGHAPVLTVRRAIAMLGIDGLRRACHALRPWPGPLDEVAAGELARLVRRCQQAGRVALALRPPGYDAEVTYLVTLLQGLGRMVVQYHFADEARQIRRLMEPAASEREGEPEDAGLTEENAAYAVLGVGIEAIGIAVARQWGLSDGVLAMIRRLPLATPVRHPETEDEVLRALASCAHEAVDATLLPSARALPALQRVAQRYARALDLAPRDLNGALQGHGREPISSPGLTLAAPLDGPDDLTRPAGLEALGRAALRAKAGA